MKRLLIALFLIGASINAYAQTPVVTQPRGVTTYPISPNTIASTNVFQRLWVESTTTTGRTDCFIQNNGDAIMFVFFGAITNAITENSLQLRPTQSLNCNNGNVVIRNEISITGTSGDRFYGSQQ